MLKRQIRDMLRTLGYEEEITDETVDELANQLSTFLEFDNVANVMAIKVGCVLHQLVLTNQVQLREAFAAQLREGRWEPKLPALKLQINRSCLNLNDDRTCKVMKSWGVEEPLCRYVGRWHECEIAQQSVDKGLEDWT